MIYFDYPLSILNGNYIFHNYNLFIKLLFSMKIAWKLNLQIRHPSGNNVLKNNVQLLKNKIWY